MDSCNQLGYILLIITLIATSYLSYKDGGKSFFFGDLTEIEKDRRELQGLELKLKLKEVKEKLDVK
jgi:hypothetical protein